MTGESPRWEDPVAPAQSTWSLEEESAFPPPPVTRAPIAPEPVQEPMGTQEPTWEASPLPAAPVEAPLPSVPAAPAAPSESLPLPSASTAPLPEPAPIGVDPPLPEPALPAAPPPAADATREAPAAPAPPMQESRLTPPEELS